MKVFSLKNKLAKLVALTFAAVFYVANATEQKSIIINDHTALAIGMKVWFNESGGKTAGLAVWNEGENCASFGIGHFTWYPYPYGSWHDGFPQFIQYLEQNKIYVPLWLRGDFAKYSVWQDRAEFIAAQHSLQMNELRQFLQNTIAMQARFMAHQLEVVLPKLLAHIPPHERPYVCAQFYKLAQTESGLYAMIDYLNFRGTGALNASEKHNAGLLQVLRDMRYAPPRATTLEAFTWSAKNAITRHLANAPENTNETKWVVGWLKRVDRYKGN